MVVISGLDNLLMHNLVHHQAYVTDSEKRVHFYVQKSTRASNQVWIMTQSVPGGGEESDHCRVAYCINLAMKGCYAGLLCRVLHRNFSWKGEMYMRVKDACVCWCTR